MSAPEHVVAARIRALHGAGRCPRLVVDATLPSVRVPDRVRRQWGRSLVLDLFPDWPIQLELGPEALEADLAFSGQLVRCLIPYAAILLVIDKDTGDAQYVNEVMLGDFAATRPPGPAPVGSTPADGKAPTGRAVTGVAAVPSAPAPAREVSGPTRADAPPPAPAARPQLRVIPGGKKR